MKTVHSLLNLLGIATAIYILISIALGLHAQDSRDNSLEKPLDRDIVTIDTMKSTFAVCTERNPQLKMIHGYVVFETHSNEEFEDLAIDYLNPNKKAYSKDTYIWRIACKKYPFSKTPVTMGFANDDDEEVHLLKYKN